MLKVERPKTLKESALESLRDAITNNVLTPGTRLVERTLCETMGVSRTVVRECIRHLESERLVVGIPNSGFVVASLSDEEVKEIYEIRTLLECSAVAACCEKANSDVVQTLYTLQHQIADALEKDDIKTGLSVTTEFYELIFKTADRHVSWDLVDQLNSRISRLRGLTLRTSGRKKVGPKDLYDIVKAIEEKNANKAKEICARHLKEAYEVATLLFQSQLQDQAG
ncbi:GntR family transcriptional regulator [Marinomonas mediterranea]|jgi:Transcriptional regulators|uniref:Transcriptional regulator, GntR family n=1 Tax=Marinomonas mediterranea (strain ATCC 700492 / JCM 21426 / NBRC 103028 / MMB-1) TaxID=717774 RepID=F2JV16_MARM1|nr:GntR family transcriptional regulator [Marinomonas mediterranea]ADZ91670.1 transcriptional regulator, GntR family [Marinomonas mediterranea MMB-1]WCN09625.1 FCD domain-containing protein [Marinomonas mediterranea]WCN13714.1 FCD domain-containing protein [Marinomonas mediterranea]WCN17769.1 FCD domain-containing protein [Marinomonas mediterranea MMB-1]